MNGVLPRLWTMFEGWCFEYPSRTDDVRGGWGWVVQLGLSNRHFLYFICSQYMFNQGWVVESH